MYQALFWLYIVNAVLLIIHEMDSVYWKEWELFKLPGGINGFLLIHLPLLFIILYGLVLVSQQLLSGLIFSLLLSVGGVFAFAIHTTFISKGREEFKTPFSLSLLAIILAVSLVQGAITLYLLIL